MPSHVELEQEQPYLLTRLRGGLLQHHIQPPVSWPNPFTDLPSIPSQLKRHYEASCHNLSISYTREATLAWCGASLMTH